MNYNILAGRGVTVEDEWIVVNISNTLRGIVQNNKFQIITKSCFPETKLFSSKL